MQIFLHEQWFVICKELRLVILISVTFNDREIEMTKKGIMESVIVVMTYARLYNQLKHYRYTYIKRKIKKKMQTCKKINKVCVY